MCGSTEKYDVSKYSDALILKPVRINETRLYVCIIILTIDGLNQGFPTYGPSSLLNRPAKWTDVLINRFEHIRFFENPLAVKFETLSTELQLKIVERTSNDQLENWYKKTRMQTFYAKRTLFKKILKNVHVKWFSSIYLCEQTCSKMKNVKSWYRTYLSDEYLRATLLIGTTNFNPNCHEIIKDEQFIK